jgi:hypothetical protein
VTLHLDPSSDVHAKSAKAKHGPLIREVAQKPFEPSDGFFDVRTYGSNGFMSSG